MRVPKVIFASLVVAALSPASASGQARTFTNKSVDYVIEFPSNKWRALASSGIIPARTRKAFIYEDGGKVRLLVRRKLVDAHVTPTDMVRPRQLWEKHLSGYILKKEEPFNGRLSGTKFSYEYVQGGKVMSALIYYLEQTTAPFIAFSSQVRAAN